MPTVGRTLVNERIRQGLDLEDISRIIKLSRRTLQAIEADDFEQLPGTVFARKFVAQYAAALNLDADALAAQFAREQAPDVPEFLIAKTPPAPRVPRLSESRLRGVLDNNVLSAFTTFILTLLVCAGAYYAYQYFRTHRVVTQAPTKVVAPARKAELPPVAVAAPPVAQPVAQPVAEPEPSTAKIQADLTATEACWVRIVADGKPVFAGVLPAGESKSITADSVATVRAGNAAALSIKLNGKEIPSIGPKGQIRVVTLTPAGAQVRAPTPEVLPAF